MDDFPWSTAMENPDAGYFPAEVSLNKLQIQ